MQSCECGPESDRNFPNTLWNPHYKEPRLFWEQMGVLLSISMVPYNYIWTTWSTDFLLTCCGKESWVTKDTLKLVQMSFPHRSSWLLSAPMHFLTKFASFTTISPVEKEHGHESEEHPRVQRHMKKWVRVDHKQIRELSRRRTFYNL